MFQLPVSVLAQVSRMGEAVIELSSTKTRLAVGFVKSVENTKEVYIYLEYFNMYMIFEKSHPLASPFS